MAKEQKPSTATPKAKPPEAEPEEYTFKSKYREDNITLDKGYEKRADGSVIARPDVARFTRNTWTTRDPAKAQRLRDIITDRLRDRNPLHVIETTNLTRE